jgi:hypothetical protein
MWVLDFAAKAMSDKKSISTTLVFHIFISLLPNEKQRAAVFLGDSPQTQFAISAYQPHQRNSMHAGMSCLKGFKSTKKSAVIVCFLKNIKKTHSWVNVFHINEAYQPLTTRWSKSTATS